MMFDIAAPLQVSWRLWKRRARLCRLRSSEVRPPAIEPGMKRLGVVLQPMSAVQSVAVRSGREKILTASLVDLSDSGLLPMAIRISADSTVWLDVLDGDQPRERARDTSRLHCGKTRRVSVLSWQAVIRTGLSCRK